jgi:putative ABC transport system substrate-binding protein
LGLILSANQTQPSTRVSAGRKQGDLLIDEAAKFDFVINLRTARSLGLSLPPDFIARADDVIE